MQTGALAFLIAWSAFYVSSSVLAAFWFTGFPADGPFTTFNSLRRTAAGQTPGLDFPSYLGFGIPALHYPLFALFGKTINAAELSRQAISFLVFVLALVSFTYAVTRKFGRALIAMTGVIFILEILFPFSAGPGNSLIGVRSTAPVLAFAFLQAGFSDTMKGIGTGLCIALGLLLGFEQGIALTIAFIVVSLACSAFQFFRFGVGQHTEAKTALWRNVRFTAVVMLTATVSTFALGALLCGIEGMSKAIHYALVELPADKFWYDGSPPNPFLGTWADLLTSRHYWLPFMPTLVGGVFLLLLLPRIVRGKMRISADWELPVAIMLFYGMLSSISLLGMLGRHYTFPLCRVLILVTVIWVAHNIGAISQAFQSEGQLRRRSLIFGSVFLAVCLIAALPLSYFSARNVSALARHIRTARPAYSKYLGDTWNRYMAESVRVIDSHRQNTGPLSLWSTYAGLLEAHYGIFHPVGDYLTLEVGPERRSRYSTAFRELKPEFVQTISQRYFDYEEWLENVNWPFFEDVVNNYDPLEEIEHAVLWHRKPVDWIAPSQQFETLTLNKDCNCVVIPSRNGLDRIAVVKLSYAVRNPWTKVPLIGLTPRYLVTPEGSPRSIPISLPPYKSEIVFPIAFERNRTVTLRFTTKSLLAGATYDVDRVEWKRLPWERSQQTLWRN